MGHHLLLAHPPVVTMRTHCIVAFAVVALLVATAAPSFAAYNLATSLNTALDIPSSSYNRQTGCVSPVDPSIVYFIGDNGARSEKGVNIAIFNSTYQTSGNATRVYTPTANFTDAGHRRLHSLTCNKKFLVAASDVDLAAWDISNPLVPVLVGHTNVSVADRATIDASGSGYLQLSIHRNYIAAMSLVGETADVLTFVPIDTDAGDQWNQRGSYKWWSIRNGIYENVLTIADSADKLRPLGVVLGGPRGEAIVTIASDSAETTSAWDPLAACERVWDPTTTYNWTVPVSCSRLSSTRASDTTGYVTRSGLQEVVGLVRESASVVRVYLWNKTTSSTYGKVWMQRASIEMLRGSSELTSDFAGVRTKSYESATLMPYTCADASMMDKPYVVAIPGGANDIFVCPSGSKLYIGDETITATGLNTLVAAVVPTHDHIGRIYFWYDGGTVLTFVRDSAPTAAVAPAFLRAKAEGVVVDLDWKEALGVHQIATATSLYPSIVYPGEGTTAQQAATLDLAVGTDETDADPPSIVASRVSSISDWRTVSITPDAEDAFGWASTALSAFSNAATTLTEGFWKFVLTHTPASTGEANTVTGYLGFRPVEPQWVKESPHIFDGDPTTDVSSLYAISATTAHATIRRTPNLAIPCAVGSEGAEAGVPCVIVATVGNVPYVFKVNATSRILEVDDDLGVDDILVLPGYLGQPAFALVAGEGYAAGFNATHVWRFRFSKTTPRTQWLDYQENAHGLTLDTHFDVNHGAWLLRNANRLAVHTCVDSDNCVLRFFEFRTTARPSVTNANRTVAYTAPTGHDFAEIALGETPMNAAGVNRIFIAVAEYAGFDASGLPSVTTQGVVYHAVVSAQGVLGDWVRLEAAPEDGSYEALFGPPSGMAKHVVGIACNPLHSGSGHCLLLVTGGVVNVVFPPLPAWANATTSDSVVSQSLSTGVYLKSTYHYTYNAALGWEPAHGDEYIYTGLAADGTTYVLQRIEVDAPAGFQLHLAAQVASVVDTGVYFGASGVPCGPVLWAPDGESIYVHALTGGGLEEASERIHLLRLDSHSGAPTMLFPVPGLTPDENAVIDQSHGILDVSFYSPEECVVVAVNLRWRQDHYDDHGVVDAPQNTLVQIQLTSAVAALTATATVGDPVFVQINLARPLESIDEGNIASMVERVINPENVPLAGEVDVWVTCLDIHKNPPPGASESAPIILSPKCRIAGRTPNRRCQYCYSGFTTPSTLGATCAACSTVNGVPRFGEDCTQTLATCNVDRCGTGVVAHGSCTGATSGCSCASAWHGARCEQDATTCGNDRCNGHGDCIHGSLTTCACDVNWAGTTTGCDRCADVFSGATCADCADASHTGAACDKCANGGVYPACLTCADGAFGDYESCAHASQEACDRDYCGGHGTCEVDADKPLGTKCACSGWMWKRGKDNKCEKTYFWLVVGFAAVAGALLLLAAFANKMWMWRKAKSAVAAVTPSGTPSFVPLRERAF